MQDSSPKYMEFPPELEKFATDLYSLVACYEEDFTAVDIVNGLVGVAWGVASSTAPSLEVAKLHIDLVSKHCFEFIQMKQKEEK